MSEAVAVVLVGGHESADGADLARLLPILPNTVATAAGRELHERVSGLLATGRSVVVVPMTFGRDVTMVADAAKTLGWLAREHPGRLALAMPFGTTDHLGAWLRTAANRARVIDEHAALVVQIPSSNPFDEAEMHRIAYLVAAHGALGEVAVAVGDDAAAERAAQRMRRLGHETIVFVPGGFAAEPVVPSEAGIRSGGALIADAAIARIVGVRTTEALESLALGHDGIDGGLSADHGHGYAHSHAFEHSHGAGHSHSHGAGHSHSHGAGHSHTHGDGHSHTHAHEHSPAYEPSYAAASAHEHHAHDPAI